MTARLAGPFGGTDRAVPPLQCDLYSGGNIQRASEGQFLLSAKQIYETSVFWKGCNLGKLSPGCWWIRTCPVVSQGR